MAQTQIVRPARSPSLPGYYCPADARKDMAHYRAYRCPYQHGTLVPTDDEGKPVVVATAMLGAFVATGINGQWAGPESVLTFGEWRHIQK